MLKRNKAQSNGPDIRINHHGDRCRKYMTVIGSICLVAPNGIFWYWGNISVYALSYLVSDLGSTSGVDSPWVLSMYFFFWTLNVPLSSLVANFIGRRYTILLGIIIFNTGIFCSQFTVKSSVYTLALTMGMATGTGTGLIDGSALQLVIDWADKDLALLTALLQGSLSFGGLLINQVLTFYTNPENLSPDLHLGPTKYFTQNRVLDKVPSMFFLLGCVSVVVHVVGCALLRPRRMQNDMNFGEIASKEDTPLNSNKKKQTDNSVTEIRKGNQTVENVKMLSENEEEINFTFKEMLKTKSFYTLWSLFFICGMTNILASNYYKVFGQMWIQDDHFMADIATVMAVVNTVVSTLWGFLIDKFGVKNCQIFFFASLAFILFWYYFTVMFNKWVFFLSTVVFGCVATPVYSTFTAATVILYGKKYFTANFGLLMSSQLCFYVFSPFLMEFLLTQYGWFVTYTLAGILVMVCLIPIFLFIPKV